MRLILRKMEEAIFYPKSLFQKLSFPANKECLQKETQADLSPGRIILGEEGAPSSYACREIPRSRLVQSIGQE